MRELLLGVFVAVLLAGIGGRIGWELRDARVQAELRDAAEQAVTRAREDAATESRAALASAKAQADGRAKARERQHNLDLELAKDEAARNCGLGPAAWRVLSGNLRAANAEIAAFGGHDGVRGDRGTGEPLGGGLVPRAGLGGVAIRGGVPAQEGHHRLD